MVQKIATLQSHLSSFHSSYFSLPIEGSQNSGTEPGTESVQNPCFRGVTSTQEVNAYAYFHR
jgi:hypothetical protein